MAAAAEAAAEVKEEQLIVLPLSRKWRLPLMAADVAVVVEVQVIVAEEVVIVIVIA